MKAQFEVEKAAMIEEHKREISAKLAAEQDLEQKMTALEKEMERKEADAMTRLSAQFDVQRLEQERLEKDAEEKERAMREASAARALLEEASEQYAALEAKMKQERKKQQEKLRAKQQAKKAQKQAQTDTEAAAATPDIK